jgi:hypothetical protein
LNQVYKLNNKYDYILLGFRDTSVYGGRLIHFYKRAQILCGDVWAAYRKSSSSTSPYKFEDIDKLTMFADYRWQ